MNKKGFTLIELLAVVVILGIIATLATPNIIKMIDKVKKEQFIMDAKEMISKAKYKENIEKYQGLFTVSGTCKIIKANDTGFNKKEDPDGNYYDLDNSKVKMCVENGNDIYYVVTKSIKKDKKEPRGVVNISNASGYIKESDLNIDFVN